jgi:hypothetical protein
MKKKERKTFKDTFITFSTKFHFDKWIIAGSMVFFFLVSFNRSSSLIRRISLLTQYRPYITLPIFGLVALLVLAINNKNLKKAVLFFLIMVIFSLSLAGVWANTQTENYFISGLIPRSDAGFQYAGVLKLLNFGELNGPASRRPFFAEFFAILLALSNRNLQLAIAWMTLLVAISTFYAAIEMQNTFNGGTSIVFLMLTFLFYSRFVGTTMTENLGLILGLLSFALYLHSIRVFSAEKKRSEIIFVFATFLFSLGQNARPGAVFTLPVLIILAGFIFHNTSKSFNWKMGLFTLLASMLPFAISQIHFLIAGFKGTIPMSNMAYGLYGFIKGGLGWNQIFYDHPGINQLTMAEQNKEIFSLIMIEVFENPQNTVLGFVHEFKSLFTFNSQAGLLSFIQFDSPLPNILFSIFMIILYTSGIIRIILNRKSLIGSFSLTVIIGFVLSLPFAPASQTLYMRVYAVSIPFLLCIPIYGLDFLISKIPLKSFHIGKYERLLLDNRFFPAIIASLIIFSPAILVFFNTAPPKNTVECPQKLASSVVYFHPNSVIHVVEDDQIVLDWVPITHQERFRRTAHNICCQDDIAFYKSLSAPISIFASIDTLTGNNRYFVVADTDSLPQEAGWLRVCGSVFDIYGDPSSDGFLYPKTITKLNQ